ncbi:MAG: PKD domain-containing protein, partial [Acidobacteriota bacterium]
TAFLWSFGDGATGEGVVIGHAFDEPGRYTATLEVVDNVRLENSTVVDGLTITVNASPQPLIRVSATVVCAEQPVLFDASGSLDVDGGISDFRWDFGDGTSAVGAEISHAYDRPGLYQVTLAVDDGSGVGNSGSESSLEMTVNKEPVADAGPDRIVCLGDDVSFDGSASVDTDGSLAQFRWSFGDGAQAQGRQVSHVFESHGDFDIVLEVGDEHGLGCSSDSDTATTRVNTPPVAVAGPDRQGFVGGAHDALRFDALASSDADGDPLTFVWDFGDGTTGSGATVYHQYDRPGRFTVRLSVSDPTGLACGTTTDEVSVVISER